MYPCSKHTLSDFAWSVIMFTDMSRHYFAQALGTFKTRQLLMNVRIGIKCLLRVDQYITTRNTKLQLQLANSINGNNKNTVEGYGNQKKY